MAKIGNTPAANRYAGLSTGPQFVYSFETQAGIPVDGTNENLRNLSPFTLRILPPDVLFSQAALLSNELNTGISGVGGGASEAYQNAQQQSVDLISQAAQGANGNGLAGDLNQALSTVTLIDVETSVLQSYVTDGQFLTNQDSAYTSTIVNVATAADIALQLQYIVNAPPLTLLVNPDNLSLSFTKIQSYSSRGRNGYIFESWGEEQPTLSISGTTGGFMSGVASAAGNADFGQENTSAPSGLQFAAKRDSAAWQNFMSLYTFYRNNGYIYDTLGGSEAHLFIGAIAIDYDQFTYVGSIDSFSYDYDETKQHTVTFNLEFTVSRMFDWAQSPSVVLPMNSPTASPSSTGGISGSSGTSTPTSTGGIFSSTTVTLGEDDSNVGVPPIELLF